jgi:hypothetical protein
MDPEKETELSGSNIASTIPLTGVTHPQVLSFMYIFSSIYPLFPKNGRFITSHVPMITAQE